MTTRRVDSFLIFVVEKHKLIKLAQPLRPLHMPASNPVSEKESQPGTINVDGIPVAEYAAAHRQMDKLQGRILQGRI